METECPFTRTHTNVGTKVYRHAVVHLQTCIYACMSHTDPCHSTVAYKTVLCHRSQTHSVTSYPHPVDKIKLRWQTRQCKKGSLPHMGWKYSWIIPAFLEATVPVQAFLVQWRQRLIMSTWQNKDLDGVYQMIKNPHCNQCLGLSHLHFTVWVCICGLCGSAN